MNEIIKIMVADDHVDVVEGLPVIINTQDDMQVVAQANSASDAEDMIVEFAPDVVILDLSWHGNHEMGLDLISSLLSKLDTPPKIIAVSNYPELLPRAKRLGAHPLEKGYTKQQLLDTIRWVNSHGDSDIKPPVSEPTTILDKLTAREKQVLGLVVRGHKDRRIAHELGISLGTAKKHVGNILAKLKVQSRTEAATIALRLNLIDDEESI